MHEILAVVHTAKPKSGLLALLTTPVTGVHIIKKMSSKSMIEEAEYFMALVRALFVDVYKQKNYALILLVLMIVEDVSQNYFELLSRA